MKEVTCCICGEIKSKRKTLAYRDQGRACRDHKEILDETRIADEVNALHELFDMCEWVRNDDSTELHYGLDADDGKGFMSMVSIDASKVEGLDRKLARRIMDTAVATRCGELAQQIKDKEL